MTLAQSLTPEQNKAEVEKFYDNLGKYLSSQQLHKINSARFPENIPYIFVTDIESSGFMPSLLSAQFDNQKPAQVLEIAINVVCTQSKQVIDSFHSYVAHDSNLFCWAEEAAKVHGLTIEDLKDQPSLPDAMHELELWALRYTVAEERWGKTYYRMYMSSHNPVFDQPMLENSLDYGRHFGDYEKIISLHYRCPDAFTIGLDYGFPNSTKQKEAAGMDMSRNHNAQADTNVTTAMILRWLRDMK